MQQILFHFSKSTGIINILSYCVKFGEYKKLHGDKFEKIKSENY